MGQQDQHRTENETEVEFSDRLLGVIDHQTKVLQKMDEELKKRPTKVQGLVWILGGLLSVLIVVVLMFLVVLHVSQDNQDNGKIIKAATGCGNTNTVAECETVIALRSQAMAAPFLQQTDCLLRKALLGQPPPERYDIPCKI